MTRSGVAVAELIPCPGLGSGLVADRLVQVVSGHGGYRAARVGPDRVQFARTFRPTWAIVATILLAPVLLVGLLFLLVRKTEVCVALIEEDHRGTGVRLSGRLDRDVLAVLRQALADPHSAAAAAARANAVGAPVSSAYEPVARAAQLGDVRTAGVPGGPPISSVPSGTPPAHAPPQPITRPPVQPAVHPTGVQPASPAASPQPPSAAPPQSPGVAPHAPSIPPQPSSPPAAEGLTNLVAPAGVRMGGTPAAEPTSPLRLQMDDGREVPLDRVVLIGRDPVSVPGEAAAYLVSIQDDARSVSKTHLAVHAEGGRAWVTDRHSTNGTFVVADGRPEVQVVPGDRIELPPGSVVRFGTRTARVVQVGSQ